MKYNKDHFKRLTKKREQNLIDSQKREKERLDLYAKTCKVLYPVVAEICEEFTSALGFRLVPVRGKPLFPRWYTRRKIRRGCYDINYKGRRGTLYCIEVRTRTPLITVRSYWEEYGMKKEFNSEGTAIDTEDIGTPPDPVAVKDALAIALEKAAGPYVANL